MKIPAFRLFGFQRPSDAVLPALGKLERAVLECAWQRGTVSVRDVHDEFAGRVAYTTLMTTLDRLYKKNLLARHKDGRAFIYAPRVSPAEFERGIAVDVLDALLGRDAEQSVEPVLACIVDAVSERDRELLDELERLVKEKRRQLRRAAARRGED